MLGPWRKANWKWSNRSEHRHFRTGMGEFKSNDHSIYYCGQESLRRNGVAIIVNRRVWNAVLGCSLKNDRMISVWFQGKLMPRFCLLFFLWLHPCILSGVISPLISSSILGTYQPGEIIFLYSFHFIPFLSLSNYEYFVLKSSLLLSIHASAWLT